MSSKAVDNMSNHTPGPWSFENDAGIYHINAPHVGWVCETTERDARLIAAAPDMYEALRRMEVEFHDYHYHGCPSDRKVGNCECFAGALLNEVRAALAKANGRNPEVTSG